MSLRSWPEQCKPMEDLERAGRVSEPPRLGAAPIPAVESEKAFQAEVRKLAKNNGWLPWSCTISQKSAKGWPDLTLIRGNRIIFAELKYATERTAAQITYGEALAAVGGNVEYYCWRPEDWPQILAKLS